MEYSLNVSSMSADEYKRLLSNMTGDAWRCVVSDFISDSLRHRVKYNSDHYSLKEIELIDKIKSELLELIDGHDLSLEN